MAQAEAFEACRGVIRALESIRVDYFVGGSIASSFHGTPRSTHDADLVADLRAVHAPLLAARLEGAYYVNVDDIRKAVRTRSSFNVIYLKTMFKVDVFVLKDDPLARAEMRRRQRVVLGDGDEIEVASAEDTVLQKLAWYRLGNEVSDRQWTDVLGVLKVCGTGLDLAYLRHGADHLKVTDLLERALDDSGLR